MLLGQHAEFPYDYGSLYVMDASALDVGFDARWTAENDAMGCSLFPGLIQFATLNQYGTAKLSVYLNEYSESPQYDRVIRVPLLLSTGKLSVSSTDLFSLDFSIEPGDYKIVIAQELLSEDEDTGEGRENIDIFVTKVSERLLSSEVLVSDEILRSRGLVQ